VARSALALDPPTPGEIVLRARRSRGWSPSYVARKAVEIRGQRGETIRQESFKSQLSRWENGKVPNDRPAQHGGAC
jgi:transcriptional regulator with XRE-family HTH domain